MITVACQSPSLIVGGGAAAEVSAGEVAKGSGTRQPGAWAPGPTPGTSVGSLLPPSFGSMRVEERSHDGSRRAHAPEGQPRKRQTLITEVLRGVQGGPTSKKRGSSSTGAFGRPSVHQHAGVLSGLALNASYDSCVFFVHRWGSHPVGLVVVFREPRAHALPLSSARKHT